jgi:hypothetical protein
MHAGCGSPQFFVNMQYRACWQVTSGFTWHTPSLQAVPAQQSTGALQVTPSARQVMTAFPWQAVCPGWHVPLVFLQLSESQT